MENKLELKRNTDPTRTDLKLKSLFFITSPNLNFQKNTLKIRYKFLRYVKLKICNVGEYYCYKNN
ncbi:hypothetical protein NBRC116602_28760 [Hyphomicrobiales bacterium 4NK60-0047b]